MTANYHLKDKAALIEVSFSPVAMQNGVYVCVCAHLHVCRALFTCMWLISH